MGISRMKPWGLGRETLRLLFQFVRHPLQGKTRAIQCIMSSNVDEDEVIIEMPKIKAVSKPKNLKKRKRDVEDSDGDTGSNKKANLDGEDGDVEYVHENGSESGA